jgi:2-oxoglutarate ferredoxin oxidoreductase subunit alpha
MSLAFDLADEYRNPVVVLGDGLIGQMMEAVIFTEAAPKLVEKPWATTGKPRSRKQNLINSLYLLPEELERHIQRLFVKFDAMREREQRHECFEVEDRPRVVVCAYGTTARIAKSAIRSLRAEGHPVGLFRPITAWPFPARALEGLIAQTETFLCVEMSMGQMVDDVRATVEGRRPVQFWGRAGGVVPTVEEVIHKVKEVL